MKRSAVFFALAALTVDLAGQSLFVAVGYGGRRITSSDGITWENDQRWSDEAKDDDHVLCNVAHGHGRFIAVGGGARIGRILSTRDGREWQEFPHLVGRVATIAFGNGRFVATHKGGLLHSTDGENFIAGGKLPWQGIVHARRSACGDTEAGFRFVVIGDMDLPSERRSVSWRAVTGDGTRWEHTAIDTPIARDIAYGAGHFVCVGSGGLIESSHDGQTWQRRPIPPDAGDFARVVWTGRRFLASGDRAAWSSADALTWTAEPARIPCPIVFVREVPDVLGIGFSWGGNMWISRDLSHWARAALSPGPSLEAVAYGEAPGP